MNSVQAKFDEYAETYAAALETTRSLTGEDSEYYARHRIQWLARCLKDFGEQWRTVLDFGCGPGSSTPLLSQLLGVRSALGVDVSAKCIEQAVRLYASDAVSFHSVSDYRPCGNVDLAYCNGVFHHIAPAVRKASLRLIFEALCPGGLFSFWENNPWNVGTRYCMYRCAFDNDAVTISPLKARSLLRACGFEVIRQDFLFYFPASLRLLRGLEPFLVKLPLGGQYQVLCRKPHTS